MWANRLREHLDRLFEPFAMLTPARGFPGAPFPLVDLWEDDLNLYLEAELPGVKREQLEIFVRDRELTVSGERPDLVPENGARHKQERALGKFRRTLALPVEVDPSRVEARCDDGVLFLTLPKAERARSRRITVRGSEGPAPSGEGQ
jgi:HSP20 family protein